MPIISARICRIMITLYSDLHDAILKFNAIAGYIIV
jgi:hypothetical protein